MRCLTLLPFLTVALLACTPDQESATETGTDSASSTSSGTTDTGTTTGDPPATTTDTAGTTTGDPPATTTDTTTGDPPATTTGDPTTDGTTTEGTTGAPVDDCDFLVDRTFKSDDELECGLGPNGVEFCKWTLSFTADAYTHQYSDIGDGGTYTCDDGVITAMSDGQTPHGGTIDAATGELVWDDVVYHPAP